MKAKPDTVVTNFDGEPFKAPTAIGADGRAIPGTEDLTLRDVCVNSLLSTKRGDEIDGKTKLERYELAKRIHEANGEVELSSEEVTMVKNLVSVFFGIAVYGFCDHVLEGKGET
jgi:hypothetical protein